MKKLGLVLLLLFLAGCATGQLSQAQIEKILSSVIQDIKTLGSDVQVLDHRTRVLLPVTPTPKALPTIVVPK